MEINIKKWKNPAGFRQCAFLCILLFFILFGCKKFVEVEPPTTEISSTVVYQNDQSAASVLTGIYDNMISSQGGLSSGTYSISCLGGLSADEFQNYSSDPNLARCYTNSLLSTQNLFWDELYQEIHVANAALVGLAGSTGVTATEKEQLTGEALFMRAFLHFYGTNLFGDIPLVTTTNYLTNNTIHRSPQALVYRQVIADLKSAQAMLSDNFVTPTGGIVTTERVRPNKGAAIALLARVYLYTAKWDSAAMEATKVISNTALYNLVPNLDSVFLMNSSEAIWQMQPVAPGFNTYDGYYFILTSPPNTIYPVALNPDLVNAFEPGDQRKINWIGNFNSGSQVYYYPYKYQVSDISQSAPLTEYLMVLRLAEQYLIRAEAEAELGQTAAAISDLNVIRSRAGLPNYSAAVNGSLLTTILHERQVELFTEWGHRWFDLKRTGNVNTVMSVVTPQKGGAWMPSAALFPIPQSEISINPNLTQNPGYQP